jgi:outer membrane protein TolC
MLEYLTIKHTTSVRKLITLCSVWLAFSLNAQSTIAQNENVSPLSQSRPTSFEDYLVQLALTSSPELESSKYEIESHKQEISLAKKDWTKNMQAGVNINEVSFPSFLYYNLGVRSWFGSQIDATRFSRIATFPLWQIGTSVNFGDLLQRKHKIRFAESRKKMSESDANLKRQKLKAEVLTRYQEYLATLEILKVRLESQDAADANKVQMAALFKANKATFTDYNEANKTFADARESTIKGEFDIKLKKIALEELVNVKWETLEKVKATYDSMKKN